MTGTIVGSGRQNFSWGQCCRLSFTLSPDDLTFGEVMSWTLSSRKEQRLELSISWINVSPVQDCRVPLC